jgi:uncharacterized protein
MKVMLKLSQFTVARSLAEHGLPDQVLVYSLRTGECLSMASDKWDDLKRTATSAATPHGKAVERLHELGLFVDANLDEQEDLLSAFDFARYRPRRIYPILAVTTGCNIACTYCYEEGVKARTMTPDVVDASIAWAVRRMEQDGIGEVYPSLFGGEPLLYPELLFRYMDGLNSAADRLNTSVAYSCSSNGLFLTPELARDLVKRRLMQIQISLDGTKPIHDERRIGKRGQSTYDGAASALALAADIIPNVTLKVNFDRHNIDSVAPLLKDLAARGLAPKIDVKLEAIALQLPGARVSHDPKHVIPPDSHLMAEAYTRLQIETKQLGFSVRQDTAHTTPCMLTSNHGVIIGPDGAIYKCISLVGRTEAAVGSVFDDDYDREAFDRQMDVREKTRECFDDKCPYVPVCMGGCGYEATARGGQAHDRYCTYDNLKEYHFNLKLIRHAPALRELGMTPLSADRFFAQGDSAL